MAKKITDKKITLALDSSNSPLTVAISFGKEIASIKKNGVKQEQFVFNVMDKLLGKKNNITDIKKFFFLKGPGKFTGIRIGLTIASILKELNKTEASSATVFDVLYYQAKYSKDFASFADKNKTAKIAVVLHAFRDEYFLQTFSGKTCDKPIWASEEDLKKHIKKIKNPLYFIGFAKDNGSLKDFLSSKKYGYAKKSLCVVKPETLIALAKITKFDKNTLQPLYLKPANFEK